MKLSLVTTMAALCGTALAASASTRVGIGLNIGIPAPVRVYEAPPPRVVERVAVAPAPGYVWVPGHYTLIENRWVWLAGAWVMPPRPDAYWVEGRWMPENRQWIEGHWEIPAPPPPQAMPPPPPNYQNPPPAPNSGVATPTAAPNMANAPAPAPGSADVIVADAPPPPQQEVIVERPGPDFVWISGYWGWENGRREWYRGHW